MSDILLLYLVTRAGAIGSLFGNVAIAILMFGAFGLLARGVWISDLVPGDEEAAAWRQWRRIAVCLAVMAATSGFLGVAIPNSKDMAIIIGGKIALDAARSETSQEIGAEVLAAVRAQLKAAAKE